jgi:pentose-5-phosphate-3-epimerase
MIELAASILSADFARLGAEAQAAVRAAESHAVLARRSR